MRRMEKTRKRGGPDGPLGGIGRRSNRLAANMTAEREKLVTSQGEIGRPPLRSATFEWSGVWSAGQPGACEPWAGAGKR
jgi:hypothetical protein